MATRLPAGERSKDGLRSELHCPFPTGSTLPGSIRLFGARV